MTENKRFEIKPSAMDNNIYVIHDSKKEYTFPVLDSTLNYMFCKALNELSDENEQLRKENDMLSCELSVSANTEISRNCRIAELEEENEQLKQFKEKVFTWIDKEIARNEEAIKWEKETGADSGSMGFYNHMLKRLKKELKE